MFQSSQCPKCYAELPAGAPGGLCPKCLLQAGLASEPASATAAALDLQTLAHRFPHLEIVELLGRGGMGAVYKARQPSLDRFVAIKILPADFAADPAFAERFAREARALARLSHQNIVSIFDFGEADGQFFFVMEFVDGATLRHLIETSRLQPAEALGVVSQICDALQFAHGEGIVHRDIKPENILIDKKGRVKIADFGLAKLLQAREETHFLEPSRRLTGTNQVMGTVRYMAPEQMEGARAVDHRADIYSLGVVFYELLTGELPLGRFAPPSKKAPIDARLDDVVLRALEKEPQHRYQQASEVKTDLESITRQPVADSKPILPRPVDENSLWRTWWFEQTPAARRMMRAGLLIASIACLVLWLSIEFKGGIRADESGARNRWLSIRAGFGDPWFSYVSGEGEKIDVLTWSFASGAIGILLLGAWWRTRSWASPAVIPERLFTLSGALTGAIVGAFGLFAPLLLLFGIAAYFESSGATRQNAQNDTEEKAVKGGEALTDMAPTTERRLHAFTPGVDRPGVGIEVEAGAWKLANTKNVGNFKADLFNWAGELPESGVIVVRAKFKIESKHDAAWGDLMLGPDFIERDIGEGRYKTEQSSVAGVREWQDVELRCPVDPFFRTDPPAILLRVGVYSEGVAWVKDLELWHIPAPKDDAPPPRPGETSLRKFTFRDRPIHRDYSLGGGWRFEAVDLRTVRLFEISNPQVENCRLALRARMRTEEASGAYLRLTAETERGQEIDSGMKTPNVAEGDTEWAWYETTIWIPPGERLRVVRLSLSMRGKNIGGAPTKNQVWIKDIELLKLPP